VKCQGKDKRRHQPETIHPANSKSRDYNYMSTFMSSSTLSTNYSITSTMQSDSRSLLTSNASASSSSSTGKPDRLYVGNLSPSVDEYTLIQVFQKYGRITKLDFMFHKTGVLKGKPRGFAFVEFSSKDVSALALMLAKGKADAKDALKAMVKLHDRLLRGRKLVVTSASSVCPHCYMG
jgi:RNA recognition motif-containing protein